MFRAAALFGLVSAAAVTATERNCKNLTVPVALEARGAIFDLKPPATDTEVTDFFLKLGRQNANYTYELLKGYRTVRGNYSLHVTYCVPKSGPGDSIQILSHGMGFDSTYWDPPVNDYKYSYVNKALELGYSTLAWDRMGISRSSRSDPIHDVQMAIEVAALKALTNLLNTGNIKGIKHKYKKKVHVGHCSGSAITYDLVDKHPEISDGIILTGFSQVPHFLGYFGLGGHFKPAKMIKRMPHMFGYGPGFVGIPSKVGMHINYFAPNGFEPEALEAATNMSRPVAIGELLTVGSIRKENRFRGPVFVVTGEHDIPFCGGDCRNAVTINHTANSLVSSSDSAFKNSRQFESLIVDKAGHGLNFHIAAFKAFIAIVRFLKRHM